MQVDRLSALEQCSLRLQEDAAHMQLGWTVLLQGKPPTLSQLRTRVAERLETLPRFRRRVLTSTLQLHDPIWSEDPGFDLASHIQAAAADAPTPGALRKLAGRLLSVPLDRTRPLWRLYLVGGLGDERFAVVGQAHHALVNGIASAEMGRLLFDCPADLALQGGSHTAPVQDPGFRARMAATVGERLRLAGTAGSFALRATMNPTYRRESVEELRRLGSALSAVGTAAPRTSLNQRIGRMRAVAFGDISLHTAQQLARRHGATVDDVMLATVALALGSHLRRLGESHPWLRALVPALARHGDQQPGGSSVTFIELPTGERDPRAVFQEVARQRHRHSQSTQAAAVARLLRASEAAPPQLRDAMAWLVKLPQTFNVVVSNEPGSREPLSMLGRPVRAIYPAAPLVQGHAVSIGALSYRGTLHVGLYADPRVVDQVVSLAQDLIASFEAIRRSLLPGTPPSPARPLPRRRPRSDRPVLV